MLTANTNTLYTPVARPPVPPPAKAGPPKIPGLFGEYFGILPSGFVLSLTDSLEILVSDLSFLIFPSRTPNDDNDRILASTLHVIANRTYLSIRPPHAAAVVALPCVSHIDARYLPICYCHHYYYTLLSPRLRRRTLPLPD